MSNPNGTSNEKRVDPVVDAYRQASTREGAGPRATVRAAVLAHARVVAEANATGAPSARYIAPKSAAANDHSWMWRAAAGLVLGVLGVLMFQWMRPNGSTTETSVASAPVVVPAAPAAPSPEPRSSAPPTASTSAPPAVGTDPNAAEKLALARSMESAADRARASAKSAEIEPKRVREDRIAATTAMNTAKAAKAQAQVSASDSVASAAPAAASPMPVVAVAAAPAVAAVAPPPPTAPASPPAASPMPSAAVGANAAVAAAAAAPRYEIAARGDIAMATPKRAPAGNAERTQVAGDTGNAGNAIDSFAKKSVAKPQFENAETRRPSASAVASVGAQGAADAPRARDSSGAAPAAKAAGAPSTRGTLSAIDAEMLSSIRRNDLDAVRAAVARGANVNAKDDAGRSALQIARADDLAAMVNLLVALGAK